MRGLSVIIPDCKRKLDDFRDFSRSARMPIH
jgi:hypothetical protein